MYYNNKNNSKIFILLFYLHLFLRRNLISADEAKEIAQNLVHLIALRKFTLNLE
jgi:hypothetical protein